MINLFFLQDFWGFGVIWEDWQFLLNFKIENYSENLIVKILKFWLLGINHWGLQTIYLGVFDQLFPSNYFLIQVFNVIGKIFATILLYPLISSLTRNKLLAIFSTIIFAVHYSSYGSLQQYMTGVEYWAIVFVILFILNYLKVILNNNYNPVRLLGSLLLLYLSLAFGLYRLNAFIIILFVAELIMYLSKHSTFKKTLFRIAFFVIMPVILVFLIHRPSAANESLVNNLLSHILKGNFFIFITPLAGLALTFVPRPFIGTFEIELLQSFSRYFSYIFNYFALPFVLVTLTLGTLLSVKRIRFFLVSLVLTSLFIYLVFFTSSHYTGVPRSDIAPMAIIGSFILSLSLSFGLEWFLTGRKDILLFLLFISPLISLLFTTVTWVLKIDGAGSIVYQDGMHRYLTIPAIASSIVFAIIFVRGIYITKKDPSRFKKILSFTVMIILVSFLIFASYRELQIYKTEVSTGRELSAQKQVQDNFYNNYIKDKGDVVYYYISPPEQNPKDLIVERALYPQIIGWWSYLKHYYKNGYDTKGLGCIMVLAFPWHQKEATIRQNDGQIKFEYPSLCPINKPQPGSEKIFAEIRRVTLPLDKLFAFTIKEGSVTDITAETKKRLLEDPSFSTPENDIKTSKPNTSYPSD